MNIRVAAFLAFVVGSGCSSPTPPTPPTAIEVDFIRDIQPILGAHCIGCHGPDEGNRAAGLRLDTFEGATADRGNGRRAIVPGDPAASFLMTRVAAPDRTRMPPQPLEALTARQVDLLRAWIASGAAYTQHWSLSRPVRPPVPAGATHPVDAFVQESLVRAGLEPSPPAAPEVLLRRLSLDLTGLPPSPAEVDAFVADPSETAWLATVDRLLNSSAHAEHLTRDWLDFVGYGDTNAAYVDDERQSWPWRDWVLASFRANRPLDEFVVRQLAGDLLPGAQEDDVLGTGLLRMHPTTSEGGVDAQEWRFQHALDRGRLVGNQLLGFTVHCAQCHDHKYDPISQRDFFSLVSCFDRVADTGAGSRAEDVVPTVTTAGPLARERQVRLEARAAVLTAALAASTVTEAQTRWENTLRTTPARWNRPTTPSVSALVGNPVTLDPSGRATPSGLVPPVQSTAFVLHGERTIRALRLLVGGARPEGVAPTITEVTADLQTAHRRERVRFIVAYREDSSDATAAIDGVNRTGVEFATPGSVVLVPDVPIVAEGGTLTVRVEERRGRAAVANWMSLEVSADESAVLSPALSDALQQPREARSAEAVAALARTFTRAGNGSPVRDAARELRDIELETRRLQPTPTRVMRDDDPGRRTHIMLRGMWGRPGDEVRCAVPTALRGGAASQQVSDRLTLARWMVSEDSPTTARILANRYAQRIFGRGFIPTPDDLGVRGTRPTHPALLDWLAVELRESRWNLRAFLRLLVTSQTYRRDSSERAELSARDAQNLLLARGHRVRLDAEVLRDQASFASGLLVDELGGPPVFPYHPDGIYEAINDAVGDLTTYRPDRDTRRIHRRAMYSFWRRATLLPSLSLLDAPLRIYGTARRDETNTPTQALAILNEPFFVESARTLAERARREAPGDIDRQIEQVIRHVLGRRARPDEVAVARQSYDAELLELRGTADPQRLLCIGEASFDAAGDAAAQAAMTLVARAVLSSSEALHRE
jgi:hypothetical protein